MDWLTVLLYVFIVILFIQAIRLAIADSDLTLQWAEKFGVSIGHLRSKVVWITGASSGIGECLSYELAAAGCKLILSARRKDQLERVKQQCLKIGLELSDGDVLVLPFDVTDFFTHPEVVDTALRRFHKIDILVNNAGRSQRCAWEDISLEVDREMLDVNVLGVLSLTKVVLPHMVNSGGGHIAVVSSLAGKIGDPCSSSYSGSKYALQGWFETLRMEGHVKNIRVTMICPGHVFSNIRETAMTGVPGQMYGVPMKASERRISTQRCAKLMAVALANELDEVWISNHPILLFTYISQYMPVIASFISKRVAVKVITRMRQE